jgi:hypothetical protein
MIVAGSQCGGRGRRVLRRGGASDIIHKPVNVWVWMSGSASIVIATLKAERLPDTDTGTHLIVDSTLERHDVQAGVKP